MMKPFLAAASVDEIAAWCAEKKFPKFRAKQINEWLNAHFVVRPDQMTNLPAAMREQLAQDFYAPGAVVSEIASAADGVDKLLLDLVDGEAIEMVAIPADERLTFCLSTQVGCPVQCRFCASGAQGLTRNLYAGEILEEFLLGVEHCQRKCDNIVFMGIGEGLLNFTELGKALEHLTSPEGFAMSPRRITVSTSGYVPGIKKLAATGKEYNLAISLHAPDEATRAKIIPDKLRFPIAEILEAADYYRQTAGRLVTFEYTLLDGVNDSLHHAKALGELAFKHHAKINLIPFNAANGDFRRPPRRVIEAFQFEAEKTGAIVTRRVERGSGEAAACGQLRIRKQQHKAADK